MSKKSQSKRKLDTNKDGERRPVRLSDVLQGFPLFEDLFLRMQALNLEVVDYFLRDSEAGLLREYMEIERTPLDTAVFVSALSQLWIFGLYELLRTWRQRARRVVAFAEELQRLSVEEREKRIAAEKASIENASGWNEWASIHWASFEKAARDPTYAESIRTAVDRTERLFRRIEALRVSLAKHEVPRSKGSFAMAPGYGRIDMTTGSIYWQIVLQGKEVDLVSRQAVSDMCLELAEKQPLSILPLAVQHKVAGLPECSYGVKRVTLILADGTEYADVFVAWLKEVIFVRGHPSIPFDVTQVVDVRFALPKEEAATTT